MHNDSGAAKARKKEEQTETEGLHLLTLERPLRTRVAANGKTVTKREEREEERDRKAREREKKKNEALSSQSFGCTRRWQKALQFRGLVKSSEIAVAQSAYNTQPVITCGSVARSSSSLLSIVRQFEYCAQLGSFVIQGGGKKRRLIAFKSAVAGVVPEPKSNRSATASNPIVSESGEETYQQGMYWIL